MRVFYYLCGKQVLYYWACFIIFALESYLFVMRDLNRIKIVLVEQKKTSKWLAERLNKNISTVSKWCTNSAQPDLRTLDCIAELLNVDIRTLIACKDDE